MDKIVLLCCTGRCGSTTLMRMINTMPNTNICGENNSAITELLKFYKAIKTTSNTYVIGGKNPISHNQLVSERCKPAWYNSYNYDEIIAHIRLLIIKMFN